VWVLEEEVEEVVLVWVLVWVLEEVVLVWVLEEVVLVWVLVWVLEVVEDLRWVVERLMDCNLLERQNPHHPNKHQEGSYHLNNLHHTDYHCSQI
jgi:hypothetical protein